METEKYPLIKIFGLKPEVINSIEWADGGDAYCVSADALEATIAKLARPENLPKLLKAVSLGKSLDLKELLK